MYLMKLSCGPCWPRHAEKVALDRLAVISAREHSYLRVSIVATTWGEATINLDLENR